MNNTFGTHITLTLFGESHGPEIGCVIDGLRPGLKVDEEHIAYRLAMRRPGGGISTARVEASVRGAHCAPLQEASISTARVEAGIRGAHCAPLQEASISTARVEAGVRGAHCAPLQEASISTARVEAGIRGAHCAPLQEASISTARVEKDPFRIVSGVYQGRTTGTPLCILIPNTDARPGDYVNLSTTPRPGHADWAGSVKYKGFNDPRGGGHFSGRLTAPLVAAGAIFLAALRERGIRVGTHLARCAGVADRPFGDLAADLEALDRAAFPVLDEAKGEAMKAAVLAAARADDSVGGVLETAVLGLPAGLGSPWFDTVEGLLAHALFSIPAVKGVEFGDGFALADLRGTQANDAFRLEPGKSTCSGAQCAPRGSQANDAFRLEPGKPTCSGAQCAPRGSQANDAFRLEPGKSTCSGAQCAPRDNLPFSSGENRVVTATNHNGGVNGGLTNGMPLIFRTAVKPTPSIAAPQRTLDLATGEETELRIAGRHDPCVAPRARAVQDAVTAFVVLDLLEGNS